MNTQYILLTLILTIASASCSSGKNLYFYSGDLLKTNDSAKLKMTYYGNTTILIEDLGSAEKSGEQILIDGFVSRPSLTSLITRRQGASPKQKEEIDKVFSKEVRANINAIIPLHSHYDHLLDAPYISESGGVILGTTTDCIIAKSLSSGANCNENWQHEILSNSSAFTIETFKTEHINTGFLNLLFAPTGKDAHYKPDSKIDFSKGKHARKYLEGETRNVLIKHNTSGKQIYVIAGFEKESKLQCSHILNSDIVFLSVGVLREYKREFQDNYSGDRRFLSCLNSYGDKNAKKIVIPVHWDNFTRKITTNNCINHNENCLKANLLLRGAIKIWEGYQSEKINKITLDAYDSIYL